MNQASNGLPNAIERAQPTPLTRDLNILGENLARLDSSIEVLHKQLAPVLRPMPPQPLPENLATGQDRPQLVKAERSNNGNAMEGFAHRVESLIARVQFLQSAVEV